MKIMIMNCPNKGLWYSDKIGNRYKVDKITASKYITKDGEVSKEDAVVIEK